MNNFLLKTPGMKIREIRKKYNIKQSELTGNEITRNLISIIENDKANLTKNTAEIISNNINRVCMEKGISFNISSDELMESVEEQAGQLLDNFIKFLGENKGDVVSGKYDDELTNIEKIIASYNVKDKAFLVYKKLGDIFDEYKYYHKAYTYYIQAFQNNRKLFNDIDLIILLRDIGYCCIRLKMYKETIDFNKLALVYSENIPVRLKYSISFNNVLAYKNLGNYELALQEIANIEKNYKGVLDEENVSKINILTLKANCLKEQKYYNDAIIIHKNILPLISKNDIEDTLLVFCNLIEIYIELKDTKNLKIYIDRAIYLLKDYEQLNKKLYSHHLYKDIALACYSINNFELSKTYFYKALKEARNYRNADVILTSLDKLIDIAIYDNDVSEIELLKNQLLEIMSIDLLPANNILLLKFIGYYNDINDRESINNLISFVMNDK